MCLGLNRMGHSRERRRLAEAQERRSTLEKPKPHEPRVPGHVLSQGFVCPVGVEEDTTADRCTLNYWSSSERVAARAAPTC